MRIISSSSFFCFSFYLVVTMVRRREGGTHDGFQEDVITTACRPLHSLYGVWGGEGEMWELSSVFCYFSFRFICFVLLLWKAWQ